MRLYRLGCFLLAAAALGQEAKVAEQHVTAFTLPNGLRVVMLERHQSPSISFHTLVGGGTLNDPAGETGLVSLLGRMQMNGSETIGSRGWAEEKKALDALDEARAKMDAERNKGVARNDDLYGQLRVQWRLAVDAAQRYSNSADYRRILSEAGATDIRATADFNTLGVSYTLPSNRLELFFSMEAQRLMHPVVRDFDSELSAMSDARSKATAPVQDRVLAALREAAFTAHPFRIPLQGWPSDRPELSRRSAQDFLESHYVPGNIIIGMVGDVDPAEARRLAEKYLGPMPARPMPPLLHTVDPPQEGPRTVLVGTGKGLAWQELVENKKVAAAVQVESTYPNGQYPNLFTFLLVPAPGRKIEEVQQALDQLLLRLRTQKLPAEAVAAARNQFQSQIYQVLAPDATMAEVLALHTWIFGDWRKLFSIAAGVEKITEDDVLRAAQRCFLPGQRTTVYTVLPGQLQQGSLR